jgi:hypothetical protein
MEDAEGRRSARELKIGGFSRLTAPCRKKAQKARQENIELAACRYRQIGV